MAIENLREQEKVKLAFWPSPQDYHEAVQNPRVCLGDPVLKQGRLELDSLGLPRVVSGMFASVYRLSSQNGDWALRCFLHNFPDHHKRYSIIEDFLGREALPYTVGFDFQENGIKVAGSWFPVLKMEWCAGVSLVRWISDNLQDSGAISAMTESWKEMILRLNKAGIAHGDLQHGNVLVWRDQLKLVDYDGMYLPELASLGTHEIGHRNYQHPGRTNRHYGDYLDNFSAWLIFCSLKILSIDPALWSKLNGGDECLLWRHKDFIVPAQSAVFQSLESHNDPEIRSLACWIRYLLSLDIDAVPTLDAKAEVPRNFTKLELPRRKRASGSPGQTSPLQKSFRKTLSALFERLDRVAEPLGFAALRVILGAMSVVLVRVIGLVIAVAWVAMIFFVNIVAAVTLLRRFWVEDVFVVLISLWLIIWLVRRPLLMAPPMKKAFQKLIRRVKAAVALGYRILRRASQPIARATGWLLLAALAGPLAAFLFFTAVWLGLAMINLPGNLIDLLRNLQPLAIVCTSSVLLMLGPSLTRWCRSKLKL